MTEELQPLWNDAPPTVGEIGARYEALERLAAAGTRRFERRFDVRMSVVEGGDTVSVTSLDDDFHSMRVALRIDRRGTVTEAAGVMHRHPYDVCPRAVELFDKLVGVSLVSKPVEQTRARVARTEGCLHLLDMLSIAYRAWRISKGHDVEHGGDGGRRRLLEILPHIRDTCVSYAAKP